jgi:hypothetical protein
MQTGAGPDGHTYMTKLIATFCNFVNAPKNMEYLYSHHKEDFNCKMVKYNTD